MTRRWALFAWMLVLIAAWCAYAPGLSGGFVFDDFINLPALGETGPVHDAATFWRYITSGTADPTGRPIALLSFLLDARNWPADPVPFLRTNILLHLLNGTLLWCLLRRLGNGRAGAPAQVEFAAVTGAGLWLLHPLFVSTTLYIVQREAMLPATFTLLGLLGWVHGRELAATDARRGATWMLVAMVGGTLLAFLSKANGALLPLLALALDATVLRELSAREAPRVRVLRRILVVLPSIAIAVYLLLPLRHMLDPIPGRPWTLAERLLTQPRILVDYFQLLFVPRVLSTGVYNDAYAASTGLLSPASTLFSLLAIAALLVGAWCARARTPAFSAAVLFFFAGQVIESTTIPLELFFEHRNYLPAMLVFWPLGLALARWKVAPAVRVGAACALLALCTVLTWQRATLWGDQPTMAALWAARSPESSRAQATASSFDVQAGHPDRALARLLPLWSQRPDDLQLALNAASAFCAQGELPADVAQGIATALHTATEGDMLVHRWLDRALTVVDAHSCRGLTDATVQAFAEAAYENPKLHAIPGRRQDLLSIQGRLALRRGDAAQALRLFDRALMEEPTPQVAGVQASILASAGEYDRALAHLDHYATLPPPPAAAFGMPRVHAWVLDRQAYWPHRIDNLRRAIVAERDKGQH
ncbi:tetratricopeptide repeat protein [Lysobacter sp. KIS68-7]|uniref:tetratricopeptide repeat protein n=1 Tax=Lysobacter sp. KIS68-7 TaxID=2904252 RepID=UPI001E28273D|nr:tetratricopeptide repeat protein [Lysobacter sp. KIS68-7]UHQ19914.1 tetratricopeptide repeat protein [Lysobacter sp. KIS68-7]